MGRDLGGDVAEPLGGQAQFIAALQRAGLVTGHRLGQWTYYKRDERRIAELADRLRAEL